ncbi:MAG: sigma factor [Acidimicrobiales bacterium]
MGTQHAAARAEGSFDEPGASMLRTYLVELRACPLLTREDEARLARLIEAGREAAEELAKGEVSPARRRNLDRRVHEGRRAIQRFVQSNLRLVVSIAKRYRSPSLSLLDLIQEGSLGLIHAVARFDHRRGLNFSIYAR